MFFGQTSTLVGYWYRYQIDVGLATSIAALTVPLAVIGRIVGYLVPEHLLLTMFAVILFGLALFVSLVHFTRWRPLDRALERNSPRVPRETSSLDSVDRVAFISGGLLAGMVGFAIGEISNVTLHLRNGLPIKLSTGTSTFVLYVTLLAANVTNLLVVFASPIDLAGGVTIPWSVAVIVAPVVIVGGQVGAFLNNRLPHGIVIRLLVVSYLLVGVITLARLVL